MVNDSSAAELHTSPPKVRIRLPTLALKPRGDVTRSPKRGIIGPKNGHASTKIFF